MGVVGVVRPFEARWDLSGARQTPGGKPRLKFSIEPTEIVPEPPRASWWSLAVWLVMFAAVWASLLVVVPAFEKMFGETGITLPATTDALIGASQFARSPLGVAAGLAVLVGSVSVFVKKRDRAGVGFVLVGLSLLGLLFLGSLVLLLFSPLIQLGAQKL